MLFKEGFGRWVVASVGCLMQSRFWHTQRAAVRSHGCLPTPCPQKKASPALGALPKGRGLTLSHREATRTEGLVPCRRGTQRGAIPCPLQSPHPPGQQPPPPGATSGWKGDGGPQHPSFCSRLEEKLVPAGNVKVPSESLSPHVLDTGL